MKNRTIKSICLVALILVSLPMVAGDYLTIHFKDGHTERHFMHLVENIGVTKYDLEGNLHSDYQMQQIVMADTTYSYYLSDIESMSFAKVYEEQVKNDVETVRNVVTPIYEQCSTVEEMEGYLNEIKNIEGVEDAFRSGTDIFVKVRDWHDLVFMYPVVPEDDSNPFENMAKSLRKIKGKVPLKEDGTPVKIAVAFQMIGDARFKKHEKALRDLTDMFNEMGFEADFIPSEKGGSLDLDFYGRRMFEYDHVLLDTHGCYGKDSGIHTFLTDENLSVSALQLEFWNWVDENLDNNFGLYGIEPLRIDIDDAYICTCRTGYFTSGTFIGASQNYIGKYSTGFGNGPHIVFNGACKSLSGKGELTREHNGEAKTYTGGSSAVADIFFEKGADLYIGYINNASHAGYTAKALFELMLDGFSQESAFYNLPEGYKDETSGSNGVLIDLINPNSKNDNPKSLFFFKTQTVEKTEHELNEEFKKEQQVVLKGKTLCYDKDNGLTFGFTISNEPNVDVSDNSKDIKSNDVQDTGFGNGEVVFTTTFNPEPGRTYYYRACTWDGIHYNWGEERSFKIEEQPADEKQVMLTQNVGGTTYEIYKINTDKNDYHINPDGWKCYKSSLMLDMTKNGKTSTYTLDDNIYLDSSESHHGGQRPCLYISSSSDQLFVFINSKDSRNNYTMDGYAYRTSLSNVSFTRETVFTGRNWGWSPYFTYSDGVLSVQHFSYAGYYAMTSYRNSDGTWTTKQGNYIKPDAFNEQSEQAGNVLIDDNPGLALSQTLLSIIKGGSATVEITSGSGEYGVTNLNSSIAKATLQGTTITISALSEGDAKVVATDIQTGQQIIIEITVTADGDIVAYTSCPDSHHPHLIDLGLPSGTKWACCNVGASKPEEYGGYFSWGETTEKSSYNSDTYHISVRSDIAGTQYDAAMANWGSSWVMPNHAQVIELKDNCTSEWTTENDVNGNRYTGPDGASIFLPAAGRRLNDDLEYAGSDGYYWSSSLSPLDWDQVYTLYFCDWIGYTTRIDRRYGMGMSVRPVRKN